eukprot:352476-Chlamydomonas_euryale.AAC.27
MLVTTSALTTAASGAAHPTFAASAPPFALNSRAVPVRAHTGICNTKTNNSASNSRFNVTRRLPVAVSRTCLWVDDAMDGLSNSASSQANPVANKRTSRGRLHASNGLSAIA